MLVPAGDVRHVLQGQYVVDTEGALLEHDPVPLRPGVRVSLELGHEIDPELQAAAQLRRRQQFVAQLLLVLGHRGVESAHHVLDGVLLVGAVALLAFLELVEGHPEVPGQVLHADVLALDKLGVGVGGRQGLIVQAEVQDGHPVAVVRPSVDALPLPADHVPLRQVAAVRRLQILPIRPLDIAAQVCLRLQHAGGLAAALVVAQPVLLLGPGRLDGLAGPAQHADALQAVLAGPFHVDHILVGQRHGLPGHRVGHRVPDTPIQVTPGLHQPTGYRDQLPGPAGNRVPDDPLIPISTLQAAGLYQLFGHAGAHRLVGPDVEQVQQGVVPQPLPGPPVHQEAGQLCHGVAEDLDAPVHHTELPCVVLRGIGSAGRVPSGNQVCCGQGLGPHRRPGQGPQAFGEAHPSSPPPRFASTAPAMASTPPAMRPAGR